MGEFFWRDVGFYRQDEPYAPDRLTDLKISCDIGAIQLSQLPWEQQGEMCQGINGNKISFLNLGGLKFLRFYTLLLSPSVYPDKLLGLISSSYNPNWQVSVSPSDKMNYWARKLAIFRKKTLPLAKINTLSEIKSMKEQNWIICWWKKTI